MLLPSTSRTYWEILRDNLLTFINGVYFFLSLVLIALEQDYAASVSTSNKTNEAIATAFPKARRSLKTEVPFGSAHKWSAIAFADAAGVVKFQTEDLLFWPDISQSESAFLHRLAVRRRFGGGIISSAIMSWAVDRSRELGKQYLRLDCVADRSRLRSIYENFGFQYHSDRQVGSHFVARYEYKV